MAKQQTAAKKAAQRRRTRSPRDHTGAETERLQAEHADEIARRQGELGMMTSAGVPVDDDGAIEDYTGGDPATFEELANQQINTVRATLVPDNPDLPGGEGNAQLRGTTLQPGQTEVTSLDTGGGTTGQRNATGGTIDAAGYMTVTGTNEPAVKTNSTALAGTGPESPSHAPGTTVDQQRLRNTVDTQNATEVNTANWGIKGLAEDPQAFQDVPQQHLMGVEDLGPVESQPVTVTDDRPQVIQVNTDLEGVTFGAGTSYDFRVGRRYRVPAALAAHLEEKGYLWH